MMLVTMMIRELEAATYFINEGTNDKDYYMAERDFRDICATYGITNSTDTIDLWEDMVGLEWKEPPVEDEDDSPYMDEEPKYQSLSKELAKVGMSIYDFI